MFKNLRKQFSSEFSKNVLTLATGTTLAQAIPVAISPILTRIYTPEDFGVLSIFMAASAILGSIISGKYEIAIMLPKHTDKAFKIFQLCCIIVFSLSIILFVLIIFFKTEIALFLKSPEVENWLILTPISVFSIGVYNALKIFNTRVKNFKEIAISNVYKSAGGGFTQLGLGALSYGVFGLIGGQIISYLGGGGILVKSILNYFPIKHFIDFRTAKNLLFRYCKFPLYTLPGTLLNVTNLNILSFLISGIFSTQILGFYALANRMLGLPSVVIGQNIGQVYFQKMTETKNKGGDTKKIFSNSFKKLLLLSVPIFTFAYLTIEPLFVFVFGSNWYSSGQYAKILIPLIAIRFISSSLSSTTNIFEKQQLTLLFGTILLTTTLSCFLIGRNLNLSFDAILKIYVLVMCFVYIFILLVHYSIVKKFSHKN